jgi:hypothetical protein
MGQIRVINRLGRHLNECLLERAFVTSVVTQPVDSVGLGISKL